MKLSAGSAILAAVVATGVVAVGQAEAAQATFYVSPTGTGTTCAISAPCALTTARDAVRGLAPGMTADIDVVLRGGTYRLSEPLRLGPGDSGTGGHTVRWKAYPGEKPVFNGARKVTGWSLFDAGKNIHRAAVTAGSNSRQLYVNGVAAKRTRSALNPTGFTKTTTGYTTADGKYTSWRNPAHVEIVGRNSWKHLRCPIAQIKPYQTTGSEFVMAQPCWGNSGAPPYANRSYPGNGSGWRGFGTGGTDPDPTPGIAWIENAYENLGQPGQFYLDRAANQLYYTPRAGENLATADVELPVLETLLDVAGSPGHITPVNNTDSRITYTGSWSRNTARPFGDFDDDVHYTGANGAAATIAFTGTGVTVLAERFTDGGDVDVYVDGVFDRTVSLYHNVVLPTGMQERLAQQAVYSRSGLPAGQHQVKLVKKSGAYLTIDAVAVTPEAVRPVHDISFSGITFSYATWLQPSTPEGYRDNQAGVVWVGSPARTAHTPGAVRVSRGQRISLTGNEVSHVGGAGVDLSAATQNSSVTGNRIHDTAGSGVTVGEYDDYWQTDPALWTKSNTVSDNAIAYVGQDYEDAVGILVGYSVDVTVAHNEISHTPYSGISVGWGWCFADREAYGADRMRHGSLYSADNRVLNNRVHDVMRVLHDGAGIYTNGSQGFGPTRSVLAGNVISVASGNGIYHDEDSTFWDTHDNVVTAVSGNWMSMWQKSVSDNNVHDNHIDNSSLLNAGTRNTFTNNTLVTDGNWPSTAKSIVDTAGLEAAWDHVRRPDAWVGDDGQLGPLPAPVTIAYSGAWTVAGIWGTLLGRERATTTNNDSVTFTFTGTGLRVIGEKASDQGSLAVTVDGQAKGTVSTHAATRVVQQVIAEVRDLPYGQHTLRLTKIDGTTARVDGYMLTTDLDNDDPTLTYTGAWSTSTNRPYGDFNGDVAYSTVNGSAVTVRFAGTGFDMVSERNSDQGDIDVYVDDVLTATVNTYATTRQAQQVVHRVDGLVLGAHTVRLVKKSGTYMVVDRFSIR